MGKLMCLVHRVKKKGAGKGGEGRFSNVHNRKKGGNVV